jgi:hypothetical protein
MRLFSDADQVSYNVTMFLPPQKSWRPQGGAAFVNAVAFLAEAAAHLLTS